jgi:poly-gamma-glutamate capsule biosynthesis protein CapA/YwtB (metallophosphatase superfamily)
LNKLKQQKGKKVELMTTKETVTLLGVGDVIIDREQPETIFQHVAEVLRSADITFANCEGALSDKGYPNPKHAAHSDPRNLAALLYAGIDVVSLANNHSQDWGPDALLDTMARLQGAGVRYVGVGKNLAEAHQPAILERKGTKVGFLAYGCVGPDGYEAENDKPGYAPVRSWTIYERVDSQPGTPPRIVTIPYKDDLAAMVEDIQMLKVQVDVVVVSYHWGLHFVPRLIPMYCLDIGHAAIDAGADLILGGHTHILKGIEVYKGKVIFYSTSNFALEFGPHMRDHKHVRRLHELYGSPGPETRYTLIAKATIQAGDISQVSYIPCYVNDQAEPEIVKRSDPRGQQVFNYVEDISRSENLPVHFHWDRDEAVILPQS